MSETLNPEAPAEVAPEQSLLQRWRARIEYQGASLATICALVAVLLLTGNLLTHDAIAAAKKAEQQAMLAQVLPPALFDNQPLEEAFEVEDSELGRVQVYPAKKEGRLTAIAFQVSNIGYGGPILHLIAVDAGGSLLGVRVLSHKETPGLADKIEAQRSDWIKVFDGLSLANLPLEQWKVKKDGGQFDQFAGATITPRAVVKSALQALQFHARHIAALSEVKP